MWQRLSLFLYSFIMGVTEAVSLNSKLRTDILATNLYLKVLRRETAKQPVWFWHDLLVRNLSLHHIGRMTNLVREKLVGTIVLAFNFIYLFFFYSRKQTGEALGGDIISIKLENCLYRVIIYPVKMKRH